MKYIVNVDSMQGACYREIRDWKAIIIKTDVATTRENIEHDWAKLKFCRRIVNYKFPGFSAFK